MAISNTTLNTARKDSGVLLVEGLETSNQSAKDHDEQSSDFLLVEMVDKLMFSALKADASDVYIEPRNKESLVRFRVDGLMHDIARYTLHSHDQIVTRLKTMGRLRVDEHFAAQDSKIRLVLEGETLDIRLHVVPIIEGERVVMQLLNERDKQLSFESIGLSNHDMVKIARAINKTFGTILLGGPTESGKTTTLYSLLKTINTTDVNVTTIEDPIEYDLAGVSQIQVNHKIGITFAAGTRAIIRQNPEVIMVGEIRDEETASMLINSGIADQLVLSTLRAKNASTTLASLLDMKIDPFLISSSLNLIISQRLVRRICSNCRKIRSVGLGDIKAAGVSKDLARQLLGNKKNLNVYVGAKCEACLYTGYAGRVGIFEVMEIDDGISELIMRRANADEIESEARRRGMTTMLEDGIGKVLDGQTTFEELTRVVNE